MKKQVLSVQQINEVNNYPYGRLRTKAFFSVEFKKGKGFRSVFQTINPKNGRVNAPKKGTYSHLMFCFVEPETQHIKFAGFDMRSDNEVNKAAAVIAANFEALSLTGEMIADICSSMLLCIKAGLYWTHKDSLEAVMQLIDPTVKLLVEGIKNEAIDFNLIKLPVDEIKAIKDAGKQIEFRVTNTQLIGA